MNPLPTPSMQVFVRDIKINKKIKKSSKVITNPLEAFEVIQKQLVSGKVRKLHRKLVGRSFQCACCWRRTTRQYPDSILHLHGRQWQPEISTPVTILVLPGTRHPGPGTADWIRDLKNEGKNEQSGVWIQLRWVNVICTKIWFFPWSE